MGRYRRAVRAASVVCALAIVAVPLVSSASADANFVDVSGTVTVGGTPTAGVQVGPVTTDADGHYLFHELVNSTFSLAVRHAYDDGSVLLVTEPNIATNTTNIVRSFPLPALAEVRVHAVDGAGAPLAGAVVHQARTAFHVAAFDVTWDPPPGAQCTTDAAGVCTLTAPLGFSLRLTGAYAPFPGDPAYATYAASAFANVATSPTDVTLNFGPISLEPNPVLPTIEVSGTVTQAGLPVAGVLVGGATTDAAGYYAVQAPANSTMNVSLSATLADGSSLSVNVENVATGSTDFVHDIALPPLAQVRVRALDDVAMPVAGATITESGSRVPGITPEGWHYTAMWSPPFGSTCTSDADGRCSFTAPLGFVPGFTAVVETRPGDPTYPKVLKSVTAAITTDPTDVTLQLGSVTVVDVSGTVTLNGAPVPGLAVGSATTDATGRYLMHVLGGSTVNFGAAVTLSDGSTTTVQLTEVPTTSNVVQDFPFTGVATVRTSVVDASNSPLAAARVAPGASPLGGPLPNGGRYAAVWNPAPGAACTTDGAGMCDLTVGLGFSPSFGATWAPHPGDPSYPVLHASQRAIVGADPTSVTVRFGNYAKALSAGSVGGEVVATAPDGTSLTGFAVTSVAGNALPNGQEVIAGALGYTLTGLTPGGTADVVLHLPAGSAPTAVFKSVNATFVDVTSIATFAGDTVTLHLRDGGLGDADGIANGTIVDPAIPVRGQPTGGTGGATATVSKILPSGGSTGGGTKVIIKGHNLGGITTVLFDGLPATGVVVNATGTAITAYTPAHARGTVRILQNLANETAPSERGVAFSYLPPMVTMVSKNTGPATGGNKVIIKGKYLHGVNSVRFGGVPATGFVVNATGTSITAYAPAHALGAVDVVVSSPLGGESAVVPTGLYTYAPPSVVSLLPTSGPAAGGTKVIIKGMNLLGVDAVRFGTVASTKFTVNAAGTSITAFAPAQAAGLVDVTVSSPLGGTSATGIGDWYTYF